MNTDILAVLAWVAGPGLAAISAFVLERLRAFDELSSNGKLVLAITIAGICGVGAVALSNTLAGNSALLAQLQPYMNVLIPLISLAVQQLKHGNDLAKTTFYVDDVDEAGAKNIMSAVWDEDGKA
jgi:hypothetical protein